MNNNDSNAKIRRPRTRIPNLAKSSPTSVDKPPKKTVPRIYEVVVACRDEDDQRTVFERMQSDGYRCRVLTL